MTPLGVRAEGWGWRHASRRAWAVSGLDLRVEPGERVLLLGASGAGKSTLLHALAGVLGGAEEGAEAGRLLVDGRHPTRARGRVGLVLQDPESQVVLARVGDDVAFGLENLGVPRAQIWPRVTDALHWVGLPLPLDHPTEQLSGGQKQRLAIAGAVAMRTGLLLLDEPTANLDPEGICEVRRAVTNLVADRETTLIVVEHRVDLWQDLIDRVLVLDAGGGLLADGPPEQIFQSQQESLLNAGVWVPGVPLPEIEVPPPAYQPTELLRGSDLAIGHHTVLRSGIDLGIDAGASTVLTGPNGSGKTTLALTLAGLLPRHAGELAAAEELRPAPLRRGRRTPDPADPAGWRSVDLLRRIGTVFQQPEHQFVAPTVRDELAIGLRALKLPTAQIDQRCQELLALLRLTPLAAANPFTLSGGQKRRLSVGTVLATGPRVIFLDEPTFGQDRNSWIDLVRLVAGMLAEDRAVVSVTHDDAFIELLGQRRVHLAGR
ncbi:ABC transporter ATP-binding protein [Enemella dayhoffiae]|uniref:ABC transporter ATP-binding protein n=1 Tax=Enemella dayhoffiae TaxID=2016507 RepID=A0A255GTW7_9ACTN|nr:ABC transporter ATP-binding protein [Enemella dayhoffiae]OYO16584.1 ABC transporter ATP-binding protein [Enemella dayhoffiae]